MLDARFVPVRRGLKWVLFGVCIHIASIVTGLFRRIDGDINTIVISLEALAFLVTIIGLVFCLGAPSGMFGSGFVWGAGICTLVSSIVNFSLFFWDPNDVLRNLQAAFGMSIVVLTITLVGDILFTIFLKRVALYFRDRQNASRATALIVLKLIVFSLMVICDVLLLTGFGEFLAILLLFFAGIIGILVLIQYFSLLAGLSDWLNRPPRPAYGIVPMTSEPVFEPIPESTSAESDNPFKDFTT